MTYAKVLKDSAAATKAWQSRATGRMPLKGHPYHDKTDAELKGIIQDAGETARVQRGMSSEGKYLDQVNDATTVLYHRKQTGAKPVVAKPLAQHKATKDEIKHMGSIAASLGM